jgi:hypothetical protein
MPAPPPNPGTLPLNGALAGSEPLARLLQRVGESRRRFDAVADLLPPGLRESVRPGPLDDAGWALLAAHGGAAAKLRQLLPRLDERLRDGGFAPLPIKVRVQPRG